MKKLIITLLFTVFLFIGINQIHAQTVPPPPSGTGSSGNSTPGGSAPIGSGLFILIGLAGIYGGIKGWKALKGEKTSEVF